MFRHAKRLISLLIFSIVLCGHAWAQETLSNGETFATDVQQRLPLGEVEMLLAGTEQLPVFSSPASVPLTRGVALIVSPTQSGIFGGSGLSSITRSLNQWGWRVVILPAPVLQQSSDILRAESDPQNAMSGEGNVSQEAMTRFSLSLSQRLEAAYAHIETTPGFRLLIAQGSSAAGLIRLLEQGNLMAPDGLVVASPFLPDTEHNRELPMQLARTLVPVLDLTSQWDNRWSQMTADERQIRAVTELKMHYRQRDIVGTEFNPIQYEGVAKEIYGWITSLGW